MEPSEYKTGLLEMQKGADALWQRLFDMEKQVGASHSILESIEAMAKDIEAFGKSMEPLASQNFVRMRNKNVWFDRRNAALFPRFDAVELPVFDTSRQPVKSFRGLDFEGFCFLPMSQEEFRKSFMAGSGNPYLQSDGGFSHFSPDTYSTVILTKELRGMDSHWCWVNGNDGWYRSGRKVTLVPICRLHKENSPGLDAMEAVHAWLSKGLVPDGMDERQAESYEWLRQLLDSSYLVFEKKQFQLKKASLLRDTILGKFRKRIFGRDFDFAEALRRCKPLPRPKHAALPRKKEPTAAGEEGKLPMNEQNRVPLTAGYLERKGYPGTVYYDGLVLVDTFISASGNYVQGYVASGMYQVANINAAKMTVVLRHKPEARKLFQKNSVYHSAFETFSVPFRHVFVPQEPGAAARAASPAAGAPQVPAEKEPELSVEQAVGELKAEHAALSKRLLSLEQQMKSLRAVRDPAPRVPARNPAEAQGMPGMQRSRGMPGMPGMPRPQGMGMPQGRQGRLPQPPGQGGQPPRPGGQPQPSRPGGQPPTGNRQRPPFPFSAQEPPAQRQEMRPQPPGRKPKP